MPKGYIVFVHSVRPPVRPSVCPSVIPSVNPFYNQVLLRSFLITYNSAATDQKVFISGMGVPGRIVFHSTSMDSWVISQGGARGQNLGHPNKVVYCSLFIQTTSYYIVFVHSISPFVRPSVSPSVCRDLIPSISPFYNQVLLRSFLITYNCSH